MNKIACPCGADWLDTSRSCMPHAMTKSSACMFSALVHTDQCVRVRLCSFIHSICFKIYRNTIYTVNVVGWGATLNTIHSNQKLLVGLMHSMLTHRHRYTSIRSLIITQYTSRYWIVICGVWRHHSNWKWLCVEKWPSEKSDNALWMNLWKEKKTNLNILRTRTWKEDFISIQK